MAIRTEDVLPIRAQSYATSSSECGFRESISKRTADARSLSVTPGSEICRTVTSSLGKSMVAARCPDTQLLQKTGICRAPIGGRLFPKMRDGELAKHSHAVRTETDHGNREFLRIRFRSRCRSRWQAILQNQSLSLESSYCKIGALSYQRMTWNGGFSSGPSSLTMAETVRCRSESWPLGSRSWAVARKRHDAAASHDRAAPCLCHRC